MPATPVIGIATAGHASAVASWTAPANGGQAILGYHVRVVDAATPTKVITLRATSAAARSLTITGLANGTPVKIQVQAWNAKGWGAASAYSNAVIPRA